MTEDGLPFVTIVLPLRNEMRYIQRCLDAVAGQNYPHDRLEILAVDGMSTDNTRETVEALARKDSRIQLLDNPHKITPAALNVGIRAAQGEIVIRIDGHTLIEPDYVEKCVGALAATCADNAGGCMTAEGETYIARAIALATSSPFGVGNARFHYAEKAGWADTVYLGAYPIKVFERIGMFDEELVRNQDDEFNYRLIRAGGRIWLDPRIRSTYYSRATMPALWTQYFGYGFWKVRVIQKHGRPASLRHLVPGLFATALVVAVIAGILTSSVLPPILILAPYLLVSSAISLRLAARKGWRYLPILPLAFAVMHLAYGFGFLLGVIRFGHGGKRRSSLRFRNESSRDANGCEEP